MIMNLSIGTIIIILVLSIVVFIIIREVICWYSKINERIALQKEMNEMLVNIYKQLGGKLDYKSDKKDGTTE